MEFHCKYCDKLFVPKFYVSTRTPKYCDAECAHRSYEKKIKSICPICIQEFIQVEWEKKIYCSVQCVAKKNAASGFWKFATPEQKMEKYRQMFEEHVVRQEGCWGWKSFLDNGGAGKIGSRDHAISAYRASWILHMGKIPEALSVLHKCHNRACTNPDHLYLGTAKDNYDDMVNAGRRKASKQHAKSAKLNREKAKEVKRRLLNGESQYSIARFFEVSRGTIQDIHRGKSWKDV